VSSSAAGSVSAPASAPRTIAASRDGREEALALGSRLLALVVGPPGPPGRPEDDHDRQGKHVVAVFPPEPLSPVAPQVFVDLVEDVCQGTARGLGGENGDNIAIRPPSGKPLGVLAAMPKRLKKRGVSAPSRDPGPD
jgi:hypothetical protein